MNFVVLALFVAAFVSSVWCLIDPASVIRFRRRFGMPENISTGGIFYSTPRRARVTATLVLIVSLFGIVEGISRIF